ncbi:MAG: peptidase S58 family protein [Alphaproteobacteria bacterium]|nr:peptidase S58 family protein [Alphaproteobacteria bacterium]
MLRPGPRNSLTDVDGVAVGNAEDDRAWTGVTVVLPDRPAIAAVDARGGAPGTRETDLLDPVNLVDHVDALVLSGGSAFGLDAAAGVTEWLAARGRGYPVGGAVVPIVPAAILFDLLNGGDKSWGGTPPYRALALRACAGAGRDFRLGNAGAGLGAKAGVLKGGLGTASLISDDGLQVGALIAANPFGSAVMPGSASLWAWALEQDDELGGQPVPHAIVAAALDYGELSPLGANTTIGVVATNAPLDKAGARRLAIMAHDGLARAIRPVHTPFDGDVLFVLSTHRERRAGDATLLARLGSMAADCVARATARGVYLADSLGMFPSYRAKFGDRLRRG